MLHYKECDKFKLFELFKKKKYISFVKIYDRKWVITNNLYTVLEKLWIVCCCLVVQ